MKNRTFTVKLGGKEFEVTQQTVGASREWRARLAGPLTELIRTLQGVETIDVKDWQSIAGLLSQIVGVVSGGLDMLHDALFDYAPALASEREWVESACYDDELTQALVEVLKVAYPFGSLLEMIPPGGSRSTKKAASPTLKQSTT